MMGAAGLLPGGGRGGGRGLRNPGLRVPGMLVGSFRGKSGDCKSFRVPIWSFWKFAFSANS